MNVINVQEHYLNQLVQVEYHIISFVKIQFLLDLIVSYVFLKKIKEKLLKLPLTCTLVSLDCAKAKPIANSCTTGNCRILQMNEISISSGNVLSINEEKLEN